jgi:ADP-heptose:LPS heptosyltransferase
LAVHPGALGDVVLFGRLLKRLAGGVALLAQSEKARLLAGLGVVRKALSFDALPMHEVFTEAPLPQCRLPGLLGRHDRLISCFAGGDRKAELRLAGMCGASDSSFLPVRPAEGFRGHLLDLWEDMLGMARGEPPAAERPWPAWKVPPAWGEAARESLSRIGVDPGQPYEVIHPGAGSPRKCWPLERFVELTRLLRGTGAGQRGRKKSSPRLGVVLVLGPVECEWWGQDRAETLKREFPTLVCPSLMTLAGVLAGAAGFLGNDSGVSHLAAGVGAPTVALFGPTQARHFAPLGPKVRVIQDTTLDAITLSQVLGVMT